MNPLEISSNKFRDLAERIAQLAANYLNELDSMPVSPAITGEQSLRMFDANLPECGIGEAAFDCEHHPSEMLLNRLRGLEGTVS